MYIDESGARQVFRNLSGEGEAFDDKWGVTLVPLNAGELKKQGGAENKYYIAGGIQGAFEMDGKKIKINDEMMKFDFENKTSSNKRGSEISDLEVLLEMISQ